MQKFGFKLKTRGGMVVENLLVQARDRAEAELRISQIYHNCEILECKTLAPGLKPGEALDLEGMITLIGKQDDPDRR
jgi:hypothetical protein